MRDSVAKANAAGIPTADLRNADWSKIAALVLAPGVPLTHPEPHWTVELARSAGVEVIGDIELFCRERRRHRAGRAVRRHHRHQRQVDHDGADRAPAGVGRFRRAARRQYRHGDPVAAAAARAMPAVRVHVIECSSYQIDLAPSLDPSVGILLNVTRGSSRSPWHAWRTTPRSRSASSPACRAVAPRSSASTTSGARPWPTGSTAPASVWCACRSLRPLADGIYAEQGQIIQATARRCARNRPAWRHRLAAWFAQCAERRVRRCGGAGARA